MKSSEVLKAVGIDPAELSIPDLRISFEKQMEIWDEGARRSGDLDFGLHLAEQVRPEMFGVVAEMSAVCSTLGQALEKLVEYSPLLNTAVNLRLEKNDERARFLCMLGRAPWQMMRHYAEASVAILWRAARRLIGPDASLLEVCFQHPRPEEIGEHQRIFGASVHFERPLTELVFLPEQLARGIAGADPDRLLKLELRARQAMEKLPPADLFVQRVRKIIHESLGTGDLAMRSIARKLDMPPLELRRLLSERGTSFQAMVSSMRRELALVYLQDKRWTTTDIAFVLGFLDPASFKRSFKRWTGKTPGAYRHMLFG